MAALISESYRKLNRSLHNSDPSYGSQGGSVADIVRTLIERLGTRSVLDYGCGKRQLQSELGISIQNYDPAISGYEDLPSPADIVVCKDVLEHVEPECLESVLWHIESSARRAVLFIVGLGPSKKALPDGRNTHLIQQPALWWQNKLGSLFHMARTFPIVNGLVFIGQSKRDPNEFPSFADIGPPPTSTVISCKSVYTAEQRMVNIRSSMMRGLPTIKKLPPHDNTMILAGYGPSLKDTLPQLRDDLAAGGDLYTTSGAHRFLLDRGIVPIGHLEADPRAHKAICIGGADPRVAYFLSSACARETYDAVHGQEVFTFHVHSYDEEDALIRRMEQGAVFINGGSNVGMTALHFGLFLGYRKFSVHGMDCSFEADKDLLNWPRDKDLPVGMILKVVPHAGAHPNEDQPVYRVWVGDRPFCTSPQLLQSAQDYLQLRTLMQSKGCKFALHGDGMLKNMVSFTKRRDRLARAA